ncbi:MAG: hypothetical protein ABI747_00005 [Candidatus Moraniibacteriota bacterium]
MQKEIVGNITVWKTKNIVDKFAFWFFLVLFATGLVIGTYKRNFGVTSIAIYILLLFWTIQTLHTKEVNGEYWIFRKWWQKTNYVFAFLLFLFLILTLCTWLLYIVLKLLK